MIGIVENAILARLKAAGEADVLGYRFALTEVYPRDWEEGVKSSAVKYPAAWCAFVRLSNPQSSKSGVTADALFEVVVGAKNARNVATSRQGARDGAEAGVQQVMMDTIALLQNCTLGLEIKALEFAGGELAADIPADLVKQGVSLAVMQFTTRFTVEATYFAPAAEFVDDFNTFHSDWMPPSGNDPVISTQLTLPIEEEA